MASALTPEDAGAAGGDEGVAAARSSLRSPSPKLEESQRTLARLREHVNQLKVKFFSLRGCALVAVAARPPRALHRCSAHLERTTELPLTHLAACRPKQPSSAPAAARARRRRDPVSVRGLLMMAAGWGWPLQRRCWVAGVHWQCTTAPGGTARSSQNYPVCQPSCCFFISVS